MGIKLTQSKFTDIYGNITNEFKANAGDLINIEHTFESEISFVSSIENQITINNIESKVLRANGSFLNDGFRVGQTYTLYDVNNSNTINATYTGTILSVTDLEMKLTGLPNVNNFSNGTSSIVVILSNGDYNSVNFAFNFVDNELPKTSSPSLESYIDQETSRFSVNGLSGLAIGSSLTLSQVGKKSGQFTITNIQITRLANIVNPYTAFTSNKKQYKISMNVLFTGMYSPDSFIGAKCLKYYSKTSFKVFATENLSPSIIEFNEDANTGLWNEGFNADQANSTYSLGIDSLFFNTTNTFTITATSLTSLGINSVELGAMYLTLDDDFNKNKEESQDEILPLLKTGLINATNINDSWVSTTSKEFEITLNDFSITDLGGVRTYSLEFILNPFYSNPNGFGKFIEDRGELDREFLIWLKVGNTNRLLFDSQLLFDEPVGQPFTPITANYINHDNNIDYKQVISVLNNKSNNDFNLEDDITHISEFSLFSTDVNETINAKVVVVNISNDFEFVLDKVSFDLTDVDLQYFINQVAPLTNNLPDSSRKKEAFLYERSGLSGNEMEVRLFYPIVIDWRYWEEVLTTHPFFVSQNKNNSNWLNYQSLPWKVFVKIEIKRNGVIDYYYQPLDFKDYDDWSGISTIELFDATGATQYSNIQENMTMMIKATHIFPSNYFGNPWGMITIEPKESSPRYILSTEIDRTQTENPLVGIALQQRCDIEFYSANTIILRAYVNTNLLDGSNFCITSKISEDGQENNNPELNKLTEDNQDKIT